MIDINNNQAIQCPNCMVIITVDALGEHVSANPEIKKQAIEVYDNRMLRPGFEPGISDSKGRYA
jgi:hypothetical protein